MLSIKDLHAQVEDKEIIKGLSLEIKPGEVHAIMGPNGAGKSTLGYVLSGREGYEVTGGSVSLGDKDLLDMETEERAREGLFLAFQYPVEIPGVSNLEFLKASVDAIREHRGEDPLDAVAFMKLARETCKKVSLDQDFLKRGVNEGFSGGEKKRNEIMQMMLMQPKLAEVCNVMKSVSAPLLPRSWIRHWSLSMAIS
jgi:Fe-S cluster assembly ATP-binding protein